MNFGVGKQDDAGVYVPARIPLKKWTHLMTSYNGSLDELKIWLDGQQIAIKDTDHRPFAALDKGRVPGVGIGNVQNDPGPHNQALDGIVSDMRLYPNTLDPRSIR